MDKKVHKPQTSPLERERSFSHTFLNLFVVLVVTGFYTYLITMSENYNQWLYILHTVVGVLSIPVFVTFSIIHFRRTLGQRRPFMLLGGLSVVSIVAFIVWSGLDISYYGQTETTRWVYNTHVYTAILALILLVFHVLSHGLFLPERRRDAQGNRYNILHKNWAMSSFLSVFLVMVLASVVAWVYATTAPVMSADAQVMPYSRAYGEHPFRPSQTETETGTFIDPRQITGSTVCGECHADITRQWTSSAHKQAASDKSYITNINLLAEKAGMPATRYCEGCHSPVALLTGQLTEGGQHGGTEGTAAFHEGVGCLACHNINRVVHTKGVASYSYSPHRPYLFEGDNNVFAKAIHHFLLRVKPEQHRTDMAQPVLSDPRLCASCHAQFMDKDMNNWGWIKMQDEYTAWLESAYSGQTDQQFSHTNVTTCHDCHMPLVKAQDPSSDAQEKVMSHRFLGANTVLPLLNNDQQQLEMTMDFLQASKMRVTIEQPRRKDAEQTGRYINESLRSESQTPYYFYLGESVNLTIIVSNVGVGHDFPGGTIDINESWLAIDIKDAQGQPIYQSGHLDEKGHVDKDAYFYRNLPVNRDGQRVWRHDLFNKVGEIYRNVVKSGESDVINLNVDIPAWVKSPLTVSAVLKYRKFNMEYAKWALQDEYREIPIVNVARHALTIPVYEQASIR